MYTDFGEDADSACGVDEAGASLWDGLCRPENVTRGASRRAVAGPMPRT